MNLSEPPECGDSHRAGASGRRWPVLSTSRVLPSGSGRWLPVILGVEAGAAVSLLVHLLFGRQRLAELDGPMWVPDLLELLLIVVVVIRSVWLLVRGQQRERSDAAGAALMDAVPAVDREWLWMMGRDGRFVSSSAGCRDLTGYEPGELLGLHFSVVLGPGDLAAALHNSPDTEDTDGAWSGLVTECRHKDGTRTMVEIHGAPFWDATGREIGFKCSTRVLAAGTGDGLGEVRGRVEAMLADRTLLTAFQPIRSLDTGAVIGAEALSRFLSSPGNSPEAWFVEAASVGLGVELEILALQTAVEAATDLPGSVYVAVNVSPLACLDPRLPDVLEDCGIPAGRLVLEVTERQQVDDYGPLAAALRPLRAAGVRIAIDDAGAGFASMRHILQLRPDMVKLDREIIAGIDSDPGQRALGRAMVGFTTEIGAVLVAEGIETRGELDAVTALGMNAGQGYLLGRPTVRPGDWIRWPATPPPAGAGKAADG